MVSVLFLPAKTHGSQVAAKTVPIELESWADVLSIYKPFGKDDL